MKIFKSSFQPYKNKNVIIEHFHKLPGNSANELYYAQDIIGDYAKKNGVKISFWSMNDAKINDGVFPILKKIFSTRIGITVSRNSDGFSKITSVDYAKTENEPFLRQVYKSIEKIVQELKQQK